MYVQWFVKGIAGRDDENHGDGLTWGQAKNLLIGREGIISNWFRNKPEGHITPAEIQEILTEQNLDRHIHDYENYGKNTPFISVASGCVERDAYLSQNFTYSAVTTALEFATEAWGRPGALFFGWLPVAINPAVQISSVAEEVRNLNVYHRWSPFQLEGEITAKVHIPANQIKSVEWWDPSKYSYKCTQRFENPYFVDPEPITNVRDYF